MTKTKDILDLMVRFPTNLPESDEEEEACNKCRFCENTIKIKDLSHSKCRQHHSFEKHCGVKDCFRPLFEEDSVKLPQITLLELERERMQLFPILAIITIFI